MLSPNEILFVRKTKKKTNCIESYEIVVILFEQIFITNLIFRIGEILLLYLLTIIINFIQKSQTYRCILMVFSFLQQNVHFI